MFAIFRKLRQLWCKHTDEVQHFQDGRWWLECLRCGHESDGVAMWFRNYYRCDHEGSLHHGHSETTWNDEWYSTCDDRCPVCGHEIEPYDSEELDDPH